jgi:predicted PurR-regulated permease PerM
MKDDMKPINVKNKLAIFIVISNIITFSIIYFFNINSKNYDEINNYIIDRNNTDKELRSSIVELQNKITNLPKLFTVDRREAIINRINNEFTVEHTEIVRGRDNYNSEFSRLDKKDISSGKIVANIFKDNLLYSYGLLNTQGEF